MRTRLVAGLGDRLEPGPSLSFHWTRSGGLAEEGRLVRIDEVENGIMGFALANDFGMRVLEKRDIIDRGLDS